MPVNLEKAAQDGRAFLNYLSRAVGHTGETVQTCILLKAALHGLRDRISMSQSLHLMAQLPIFLKVLYIESWKYRDQPEKIDTKEDFVEYVKMLQYRYGEYQFDWPERTEDLIKIVFNALRRYVNEGEIQKVVAELPRSLKSFFDPIDVDQSDSIHLHTDQASNSRTDAQIPESNGAEAHPDGVSTPLTNREGLNEAGSGIGGGGAMGTTSGGTMEAIGGGPRSLTQDKGYDTLGIGVRSKSIVPNHLQGSQEETPDSHPAEEALEAAQADTDLTRAQPVFRKESDHNKTPAVTGPSGNKH